MTPQQERIVELLCAPGAPEVRRQGLELLGMQPEAVQRELLARLDERPEVLHLETLRHLKGWSRWDVSAWLSIPMMRVVAWELGVEEIPLRQCHELSCLFFGSSAESPRRPDPRCWRKSRERRRFAETTLRLRFAEHDEDDTDGAGSPSSPDQPPSGARGWHQQSLFGGPA